MMLTARNQIDVEVVEVRRGGVSALLVLQTDRGSRLYATITGDAAQALEVGEGDRVIAFFKASHVMLATGWVIPISARNRLEGVIETVRHGIVNAEVRVELLHGERIGAAVSTEAVGNLALEPGMPVVAIIKASDVMIAKPRKSNLN
jgi:molybdate transport system regulatory protein